MDIFDGHGLFCSNLGTVVKAGCLDCCEHQYWVLEKAPFSVLLWAYAFCGFPTHTAVLKRGSRCDSVDKGPCDL